MIRKSILIFIITIFLSSCTTSLAKIKKNKNYYTSYVLNSTGQNERIRFLIIHYTQLDNNKSLDILTKDTVSVHYLILKDPEFKNGKPIILQLVNENKRAWHAGVSNWNGRSNINDTSIGIEVVNPGYTNNITGHRIWYPYTKKQIAAIVVLARDIMHRYKIPATNILGHSDIAPMRKKDPGKLFPWKYLASRGIGAWPDKKTVIKYLAGRSIYTPTKVQKIQKLLKQYGYDKISQDGILDKETRKVFSAFQMHFRPNNVIGNADAETEAIAHALVEKFCKNKYDLVF